MVGVSGIVSTHSRPKAAGLLNVYYNPDIGVSTHSRLKAAGRTTPATSLILLRFNTQPPEGGWQCHHDGGFVSVCFNTQPPEGGWPSLAQHHHCRTEFQHTAARRRLEPQKADQIGRHGVSTHSRPKAAGFQSLTRLKARGVSTHSRPKAAGMAMSRPGKNSTRFNTQPPEGGWSHDGF